MMFGSHLFGLPKVSQAHLELAAAAAAWGSHPVCSLSVSWCGEVFHWLGVQSAKVSTFSGAPSSTAPVSHQDLSFTEFTLSASVS
jgi:hypothetical protein